MAIGAGGGIMTGPMGANQSPVSAPSLPQSDIMTDSGVPSSVATAEKEVASTGRLAQAINNTSPDAKSSLTNITKGQAQGLKQVLANLGISPEESQAVFDEYSIGIQSGLIIPTEEVLSNPEAVKMKIDQFVMAMGDKGMMTSPEPSGQDEAQLMNRPPVT